MGKDVYRTILGVSNNEIDLTLLNHIFITLIPKIKYSHTYSQFQPVSLCNLVFKLIAKVLANKLKTILDRLIDEAQSDFVLL